MKNITWTLPSRPFKKVGKKHAVLGLGRKELLARAGA